jgi:Alpha/beta hydrolase domain containing 18
MYEWETRLTTRDENRVVRPLEWGFEWIEPFLESHGFGAAVPSPEAQRDDAAAEAAMIRINQLLIRHSEVFFGYERPTDFRLEERHPQLFPTNVRPETLALDAKVAQLAAEGKSQKAQFLRFTSPERSPYPENDLVNARWYPAPEHKDPQRPKQAIVVVPHWNADAFSHNALCTIFNRMGIAALRLSQPYHDIRRPGELERSDYAVSANIGRTLSACRQAVVDIRCCLDWLEEQGYEQFGVLGTSLGSCYAFLASTHDPRLRVNAFNHASTSFGDVVWAGRSTRHIQQAFEEAGLTQKRLRALWSAISPVSYYERFASPQAGGPDKRVRVIYADYDLTFPREYSLQVVQAFKRVGLNFEVRVLPCGHYTTGETPFQYIDGWHLASFLRTAF